MTTILLVLFPYAVDGSCDLFVLFSNAAIAPLSKSHAMHTTFRAHLPSCATVICFHHSAIRVCFYIYAHADPFLSLLFLALNIYPRSLKLSRLFILAGLSLASPSHLLPRILSISTLLPACRLYTGPIVRVSVRVLLQTRTPYM